MKFYRVEVDNFELGHRGFTWFRTLVEARKCKRDAIANGHRGSRFTMVEIEPTKSGILTALNSYADHPDNG